MAYKVLTICGSLRKKSYNAALARMAPKLAPAGLTFDDAPSFADMPIYNHDVQDGSGFPAPAVAWADAIRAADGLLIVSPEYNWSIPGGLKNAIDWASRPPGPPLFGKPFGLVGASTGGFGTVRSQLALRQILLFVQAIGHPASLHVSGAAKLFDEDGRLTDEATWKDLSDFLDGFLAFLERVGE